MSLANSLTTPLRPLDAVRAVSRLLHDPDDTQQVFLAVEALRGKSGSRLFARFAASTTGAAILAERRQLLDALSDHAALAQLPDGSLGRAYLSFMTSQSLSANGLVQASDTPERQAIAPDARLLRDRMRDMHDLTHALTGYGRDGLGELCLLAFMFRQSKNLGMALIAVMGASKFPKGKRRQLVAALLEGFRHGGRAAWLAEQNWEALLARPLDELRRELNVQAALRYQAVVR